MIVGKLLELMERSSAAMANKWAQAMKASEHAFAYRRLDEAELSRRSREVYENLAHWLDRDTSPQEIGRVYATVGQQRYQEGVPLCEVQLALHLTKKVLWNHILSEGLLTNPLEIYQAMDLILRVQNFFDLAAMYIIRGYMEALGQRLGQEGGIGRDRLKEFFPSGSFQMEFNPERF